jgi:hypothetical protein
VYINPRLTLRSGLIILHLPQVINIQSNPTLKLLLHNSNLHKYILSLNKVLKSTSLDYSDMGLIKSAIKYGALFGIANQGLKTLDHHNQQQQQQQPQVIYQQPPSYQNSGPARDASGYIHQPFCNGQCGGRCHLLEGNRGVEQGYVSSGYVSEQKDGGKAFAH